MYQPRGFKETTLCLAVQRAPWHTHTASYRTCLQQQSDATLVNHAQLLDACVSLAKSIPISSQDSSDPLHSSVSIQSTFVFVQGFLPSLPKVPQDISFVISP